MTKHIIVPLETTCNVGALPLSKEGTLTIIQVRSEVNVNSTKEGRQDNF